ncbi:MAG: DUF4405 domain-containing protein [Verrucomicrobiota bacterium JB024]|nr:DUF4405 domain-containing protein [Verrucomicrobiota bacterium JB024]
MKKLLIRRVLNLLLWLSACFLAGTGFALRWKFPHGPHRGSGGGGGLELLGLTKHDWGTLHTWVGVSFAVLVLAHLVMAWPWLKSAAAGRKRLWAVLAGLVIGLAIPVALVLSPVQSANSVVDTDTVSAASGDTGSGGGNGPGDGSGQGNGYRWRQTGGE